MIPACRSELAFDDVFGQSRNADMVQGHLPEHGRAVRTKRSFDFDKCEPVSVSESPRGRPGRGRVLEAVAELIRQLWCCSSRTVFGVPCVLRYFRVAQTTC